MFTTIAYSMQRVGATAALTVVTPVPDQHITIANNSFIVPPTMNKLLGACAVYGTGLASAVPGAFLAQLQAPSLRRIFQQEINRVADTFTHEIHQEHIQLFPDSPLPLEGGEGLQAWSAHPALALGETAVYVWLCDSPSKPISGEVRTIRYTSVCAPATRVWTLGQLAATQEIPQGVYAVVGARVMNLTEFGLFRLIFTGYDWRPGGLICHDPSAQDILYQRDGFLGEWGRFDWRDLPRIEICSVLAAPVANPRVDLDLIKVG